MKLVDQWSAVERRLPDDWVDARLDIVVETASDRPRAAGLLGPANPGRAGEALRIHARRGGGGVGPEALKRLFARMDEARIWSSLRLVDSTSRDEAQADEPVPLAARWTVLVESLPPDWSDLHCELRLRSSDLLPRGALLCAPLNPTRVQGLAFAFRVARVTGYGTSPAMVRRCLERLDSEGIAGEIVLLRALSETRHVATQGPVFRVAGKSV